jgi:hypothetical protein
MPPYELPANQPQSGIKSHSTKGGGASNFNEVRFEDKKGHEELHFQAEKDMSTLVKHDQTLHVGTDRIIVVGNDETNHVRNDRRLTVDLNDNVVIGGTHDKTVTGAVTQIYGSDHSRKVDGQQEFFAEKNKDEHVKQAHKLTTDKKFQLNQGPTSMTFKGGNVTVDSAGTITFQANGATICLDKTGKATFDSPTGIKLVVGGSSLAILPGGVVLASPAVTAAAGDGSVVAMGADAVAMKSKTVTIEADGGCSIKGKSALKLQEAERPKGKKTQGPSPAVGESQGAPGAAGKPRKKPQTGAQPESTMLEIHVLDLNQKPQEGLAFKISMPDGGDTSGKLDKEGRALAKSSSPGVFKVTFPDLDGADWDGDGAPEVPEEKRSEASRHKIQPGDRLPAIAAKYGFRNWESIWNFASNEKLRAIRGNPNLLREGDDVSIPTKLARTVKLAGGTATHVVKSGMTPWFFDLWIRLDINPSEASAHDDTFVLTSEDGTTNTERSIADDKVPNDDSLDLLFENLDGDKLYSLKVCADDGEYFVFERVSGWDLHNMHGNESDEEEDSAKESDSSPFDTEEEELP